MPSLGADMTDGTITEWMIAPGSVVRRGDIVALVDTDKAEIDVEIFDDGVVQELLVAKGHRVPVGTPLARLRRDRAAVPDTTSQLVEAASEPAPATIAAEAPIVLSPVIRHLADEHHVDLDTVRGSGPGGRIQRSDVEALIDRRARVTPRARRLARERGVDVAEIASRGGVVTGDDIVHVESAAPVEQAPHLEPASQDRKDRRRSAIAGLMAASWRDIPHYHVTNRIDFSCADTWLAETNAARPVTTRLVSAAVLLRACAVAATRVPEMNGWWIDGRFQPSPAVDLAVAVALRGGGLITPTIVGADQLTVDEIMERLNDLVGRARRGRLRSSEMSGASLTVTNLGDLGVDQVLGIIHPPQVALIGLGTIHDEPWAEHGMVGVRRVVHTSVAGDHRATDGLDGARLLSELAKALQKPEEL